MALRQRRFVSEVIAEADDHPVFYAALLTYKGWHDAEVERLSKST